MDRYCGECDIFSYHDYKQNMMTKDQFESLLTISKCINNYLKNYNIIHFYFKLDVEL